jgi:hypothetical protein
VTGVQTCALPISCHIGKTGDIPVVNNWNEDGKTEIGVVRNGNIWILGASGDRYSGAGDLSSAFGKAGDVPVTGAWDRRQVYSDPPIYE